jgi:hypothetical protein
LSAGVVGEQVVRVQILYLLMVLLVVVAVVVPMQEVLLQYHQEQTIQLL